MGLFALLNGQNLYGHVDVSNQSICTPLCSEEDGVCVQNLLWPLCVCVCLSVCVCGYIVTLFSEAYHLTAMGTHPAEYFLLRQRTPPETRPCWQSPKPSSQKQRTVLLRRQPSSPSRMLRLPEGRQSCTGMPPELQVRILVIFVHVVSLPGLA